MSFRHWNVDEIAYAELLNKAEARYVVAMIKYIQYVYIVHLINDNRLTYKAYRRNNVNVDRRRVVSVV